MKSKSKHFSEHLVCKGTNCGSTDGKNHSPECRFERYVAALKSAHSDVSDWQHWKPLEWADLKQNFFIRRGPNSPPVWVTKTKKDDPDPGVVFTHGVGGFMSFFDLMINGWEYKFHRAKTQWKPFRRTCRHCHTGSG